MKKEVDSGDAKISKSDGSRTFSRHTSCSVLRLTEKPSFPGEVELARSMLN